LHKKIIDRFAMQVAQMLTSYQSKYKIQPIESLLLSSTFSTLNDTLACFQEALPSIKVEVFNALKKVTLPANLKEKALAEQNLSVFSSVLGLATRKLDVFGRYEYITGTNNINLLPNREGVKNQEKMKFLSRWGIAIFTVLIVLFAGWSFFSDSSKLERVDNLMIEYNNLEMLKNDKQIILDDIRVKQQSLSGMLEVSKTLTSNQGLMYSVLLGINISVPQGVSLSNIKYPGGNTMTLTGLSISDQNILQFITNLQDTKVIDKASLLTMSIIKQDKRSFKSFSIRCILAPQEAALTKGKSNGN